MFSDGQHRWMDSSLVGASGFTNWYPGEPNNDDYMHIYMGDQTWGDTSEALNRNYICELGLI